MRFYIQKLPDGKATLMTHDGLYLHTFRDMDSARQACADWYLTYADEAGEIIDTSNDNVSCSVCY